MVSETALFLHAAEHAPKILRQLLADTPVTPGEVAGCERMIRHLYELQARREAATSDAERALATELAADVQTTLLARLERERVLASRAAREAWVQTITDAAIAAAPLIRGLL